MTANETAALVLQAPTDSQRLVTFDPDNRPGVAALLTTAAMRISRACASKWVSRYRQLGELGLTDRSSVPHR